MDLAQQVYTVVRLVPPGRIVAYGDIAGMFGINPRQVGRLLATHSEHDELDLPWWRITNAAGDLPVHLLDEARARWAIEGLLPKPNGKGLSIRRHRADLAALANAAEAALGPLTGVSGPM
ncbi:MGMT family protein [Calidifontibacter terrae]